MTEHVIGSPRSAAIKAYRYGVSISVEERDTGWFGAVVRRADGHVVREVGPAESAENATRDASRWADTQASKQVDEWIKQHKSADEVLRRIGDGDMWAAMERAAAQLRQESGPIGFVPKCALSGSSW